MKLLKSTRSKAKFSTAVFLLISFLGTQFWGPTRFSLAAEEFQSLPNLLPEKSLNNSQPPVPVAVVPVTPDQTAAFFQSSPLSLPAEGESGPVGLAPLPVNDTSAISTFPKNSEQERPELQSFVSFNPSDANPQLQDWSNLEVEQISNTETHLNFNLFNTFSYAEIFMNYDNPGTQAVESINLQSLFPSGFVVGLDNGGSQVQQALLGMTDENGSTAWVVLDGISAQAQRWRISSSDFSGIDSTKISKVTLSVSGRILGGELNVQWGAFSFTPTIQSHSTSGSTFMLPSLSNGLTPELKSYASYNPNDADPNLRDWSSARIVTVGDNFAQLNLSLYNSFSQAAAYVDFDNPLTANIETVDFIQQYGQSMTLGLDNGLSPSLTEVFLAILDSNGTEDFVRLEGISEQRQYFKIDFSAFDEVDLTRIVSFGIFVEGRHVGERLNIDWKNFTYATTSALDGTSYDANALSPLAEPLNLQFDGGSQNQTAVGQIALTVLNQDEFEYQYNLWNGETAFTAVDFSKNGDLFALPEDFTFAARGGENGQARIIFTDANGNQTAFDLHLDSVFKNFTLRLAGVPVSPFFDHTKIKNIRILQDRNASQQAWSDVVKFQIKGLSLQTGFIPAEYLAFKDQMIQDQLNYFVGGKGLDPDTHLPFDRIQRDGTLDPTNKITQPTLTGFYLQMLGDFIRGKMSWPGQTQDQALQEIDTVLNSLNQIQTQFGWNGLIPWIDQGQPYPVVGIGDNANLAQSIAVMIGALELAHLTPAQRQLADAVTLKAEAFLDRQLPGYLAAVDGPTGLFAGAIYRESGVKAFMLDRLMTEFRGAIAFLLVRYPTLPHSVWNNLVVNKDSDYVTQSGYGITNLQSFEGGAFQYFWPSLRNNERDFVGFRNALQNYFVTQTDYAARNQIPGFLSASDIPGGLYAGLVGIPQIAETQEMLLMDLGSTYSLASAFSVNQFKVLDWLKEIKEQLPNLYGPDGFVDSGRSNSDVNQYYLGIDLASSILALNNAGPEAFEAYLRKRNQEHAFNLLYDQKSQFGLEQTWIPPASAPEFPDRSMSVLGHFIVDGTLGNFPYLPSSPYGVRFTYNGFGTSFDGRYWELDQNYNAMANQLVIYYSTKNSPGRMNIQLKDGAVPEHLLYQINVPFAPDNSPLQKLVIQLPNNTLLANVKKIFLLPDQTTGDTKADFTLHAIDFQHFASSQEAVLAGAVAPAGNTVNEAFSVQLASSESDSSIQNITTKNFRLHYDISQPGDFAAISLVPQAGSVFNLSSKSNVVFGLNSPAVKSLKIEIDDALGNRAVIQVSGIDVAKNYYEFLTSLIQAGINTSQVKRISFVVDQNSVALGNTQGFLDLEIL